MSEKVTDLAAHRRQREEAAKVQSVVVCGCGSGWFRPHAVTFEADGSVSGWAGPAVCVACGAEIFPGM
jgi:hypothetical protein